MDYDSLMKVENTDEVIHIFAWDGQRFSVKPGQTSLVPFQALVNRLGDPRSAPESTRITPEAGGVAIVIPPRKEEIKRLNAMYGIYTDRVDQPSYVEGTEGATLADRIPKVRVTSIDSDGDGEEEVIFPVADPECAKFIPQDVDKSQMAMVQRQLEQMRRKVAVMEQMAKAASGNLVEEELGSGTEVTEDTPQASRRIVKAG